MNMNLSFNLTKYTGVMAFYAVLTYILFPAIAYFLFGKTLDAVGNGSSLEVSSRSFFGSFTGLG